MGESIKTLGYEVREWPECLVFFFARRLQQISRIPAVFFFVLLAGCNRSLGYRQSRLKRRKETEGPKHQSRSKSSALPLRPERLHSFCVKELGMRHKQQHKPKNTQQKSLGYRQSRLKRRKETEGPKRQWPECLVCKTGETCKIPRTKRGAAASPIVEATVSPDSWTWKDAHRTARAAHLTEHSNMAVLTGA